MMETIIGSAEVATVKFAANCNDSETEPKSVQTLAVTVFAGSFSFCSSEMDYLSFFKKLH